VSDYADAKLLRLARLMIFLERRARIAEHEGSTEEATELWARREDVQYRRSVYMRQRWEIRREHAYERAKSAV